MTNIQIRVRPRYEIESKRLFAPIRLSMGQKIHPYPDWVCINLPHMLVYLRSVSLLSQGFQPPVSPTGRGGWNPNQVHSLT